MDYRDLITLEPDKMGGLPCIASLGIKVWDVLNTLTTSTTEAEILAAFPGLTSEALNACIAFAKDRMSLAKDIRAENPNAEVWKYLRFFLDIPATADLIRGIHGISPGIHKKNISKQAEQISFCIRQAEQYFMASARVELPTRPVLLYYGAVCLSQALVLIKKDGAFSLDARRRNHKHNHHGLELKRGLAETAAQATSPQSFLEAVECVFHRHRDTGQPLGHFALFYQSLAPPAIMIRVQLFTAGKNTRLERDVPQNSADVWSLECVANRGLNAWEICKGLPDLYFSLGELGTPSNLCRGSVSRQITYTSPSGPLNTAADATSVSPQNVPTTRVQYQDAYFLNGVTPEQENTLLAFYRDKNPAITVVDDLVANLHLSLAAEGPDEVAVGRKMGYCPDIVEDLAGRKYYIVTPDTYVPEPAAIMALLFCFSMLCRYYPDVWMRTIDKNVRTAELINVFLNVAYRKFPNLILDQLTLTKHSIHP